MSSPTGVGIGQQPRQQRQKRRRLFPRVGAEQLLGLVDRQHQCRRRRGRRRIQQPVARGYDRFGQPGPHGAVVGDRVLDLPQARLDQTDLLAQVMDRVGQAGLTGQRVTLRAHPAQRQETSVVAAQAGQQAGTQKRRLPHPGRPEDGEHPPAARDTHFAKFVQCTHDLRVPSEIDCGIH
jgi:hypothetical protein